MATKKHMSAKLSEQIYELLKRDIVECRLEPGQLLEDAAMRKLYSIGRTPFREACQRLEGDRLVEIIPHRGAYVTSFAYDDINDLFELRMIVEPAVAELACRRSTRANLTALEENIAESRRLIKMNPLGGVPKINWNSRNFHLGVARLTGNKELISAMESIHDKLMRLTIFTARRSPQDSHFNAIHPEILEAIRCSNTAEARRLMTNDIQGAWDWVKDFGGRGSSASRGATETPANVGPAAP